MKVYTYIIEFEDEKNLMYIYTRLGDDIALNAISMTYSSVLNLAVGRGIYYCTQVAGTH